jgi:Na+/melibiose symporter-like transporter
VLLVTIRTREAPPPAKAEREPVLREIAIGLRLVARNPILRATTLASMATASMWGVFGATYFLFAIQDLHLDAAAIGLVAAVGGVSSLFGALLTAPLTRRFGVGRVVMGGVLVGMLGSYFIPLAPAGAGLVTIAFLVGQQLVTDPSMTAFDITDTSIRQSIVRDRQLGRVNATVRVAVLTAQLTATLLAGFLAAQIGLRTVLLIGPAVGLLGVIAVWLSPVRRLRRIEDLAPAD